MLQLKDVLDVPLPIIMNILGFGVTVFGTFFGIFKFIMIKIDRDNEKLKSDIIPRLLIIEENTIKREDILPRINSIEEQINNVNTMLVMIMMTITQGKKDD